MGRSAGRRDHRRAGRGARHGPSRHHVSGGRIARSTFGGHRPRPTGRGRFRVGVALWSRAGSLAGHPVSATRPVEGDRRLAGGRWGSPTTRTVSWFPVRGPLRIGAARWVVFSPPAGRLAQRAGLTGVSRRFGWLSAGQNPPAPWIPLPGAGAGRYSSNSRFLSPVRSNRRRTTGDT